MNLNKIELLCRVKDTIDNFVRNRYLISFLKCESLKYIHTHKYRHEKINGIEFV